MTEWLYDICVNVFDLIYRLFFGLRTNEFVSTYCDCESVDSFTCCWGLVGCLGVGGCCTWYECFAENFGGSCGFSIGVGWLRGVTCCIDSSWCFCDDVQYVVFFWLCEILTFFGEGYIGCHFFCWGFVDVGF